ncbi:shikimate dehydrogenase [Herbiconiux moechotypicola]|uniref:Shikimate dehydrogenase n=1 Tax=Herbiconiux moechotypicola TaxID=637393 RepID=A0ABP5QYD4_9MICO|nr:shikimate dehydrogenase [Herbiconiux moechotypicola]MCS5731170.1 shikimate dehydrogenase [Herbiconiux moechotypicola]
MTSTFWFFGVTTGQSAMQRIYPLWMEHLGIDSELRGIDFALDAPAEGYRAAVERIRDDPASIGALITTHKLAVLNAARDLFDELDDSARLLHEVSCIAKRGDRMLGAALDDRTSSLALRGLAGEGWWDAGGELLLLGAGGASVATVLGVHRAAEAGLDAPARIRVTARSPHRLSELTALADSVGLRIPLDPVVAADAAATDAVVATLPPHSIVVNATGMGKDRPGSPTSDGVRYPDDSIAWDMNYRGERLFLEQARAQGASARTRVVDGWDYFVHSWTHVVAVVHQVDISGPVFDEMSAIARSAMA